MADVLTQSQIDELLKAMMEGDESSAEETASIQIDEELEWKLYDFNSPKKFTKDKLRLLKSIYDNYVRLFSLQMGGMLRTSFEAKIYMIEEQRYFEFSNMLNENDVMTTMELRVPGETKSLPMLFHISPNLMFNMMDRMMGGPGNDLNMDDTQRYSDIEIPLYKRFMQNAADIMKNAWSVHLDLEVGQTVVEDNPALFQSIRLDETVVLILINIQMSETVEGNLTICIPGALMTQIFDGIDAKKLEDDEASSTHSMVSRQSIMRSINETAMEIKVQLGGTTLNLEDIYNLQKGDVIDLNKPKDSDVMLFVEGQPWFEGKLGVFKKNTAVRIERRLTHKEEETDTGLQFLHHKEVPTVLAEESATKEAQSMEKDALIP